MNSSTYNKESDQFQHMSTFGGGMIDSPLLKLKRAKAKEENISHRSLRSDGLGSKNRRHKGSMHVGF
jgi:hypothetical protein